jgi:hypothetical protein
MAGDFIGCLAERPCPFTRLNQNKHQRGTRAPGYILRQNTTQEDSISIIMAAGQKLYPRATVKKIVKAHSKRNVTKNVDVLVSIIDASSQINLLMLSRYSSTTRSSYKRTRISLPFDGAPMLRVQVCRDKC